MKKNDLAEIKKMDIPALLEKSEKTRGEVKNLILDKNMNKASNLKLVKSKRKDLAQVLTVLKQKQLIKEMEKNG